MTRLQQAAVIVAGSLALAVAACTDGKPDPMTPTPPALPAVADAAPPTAVPEADLKALADGNNAFAIDLYKKLAEKETGNILFSPYSISAALAMTSAGARGETAVEMAKVLGLTELGDRAHAAHAALARGLRSDGGKGGPEFHIANALWGQKGLPFRPEFLRLTSDQYGAGLREVDFAGDADGSRRTINRWVGEQTRDKIPELLKPTDLSSASKLVLTNAIYFKAGWANPFPKAATKDGPFYRTPTDPVTVPLMHLTARLRYAEVDAARVVELPYVGGEYSVVVVLPAKPEDMGRVQASLSGRTLADWLARAGEWDVKLTLPKFTMRKTVGLAPVLERLGMASAFGAAANFSGTTDIGGLKISAVVHDACVELDEKGIEAAAAAAVSVDKSKSHSMVVCRFDRPFYLLLWHRTTRTVLFVSRVANPLQ